MFVRLPTENATSVGQPSARHVCMRNIPQNMETHVVSEGVTKKFAEEKLKL